MGRLGVRAETWQMPSAKHVRLALAGIGVIVVAVFFLFVDLGGTVSGWLHPASAIVIAVWAAPFLLYVGAVRSGAASVLGGLGLDAALLWALISLFRDTHSTAGIGLFVIPMLIASLAALIVAVDSLCRRWGPRSRGSAS